MEFRCELFNALNHPNFFLPGGDLSNSKTFEIINQAFPARSVQFAGKFYFRAAREQADIAEPRA